MSIDSQVQAFIKHPNDYFLCKQGENIVIEKKGFGIKKWIYTLLRSDRYDLAKIVRQVEQIVRMPESQTSLNKALCSKIEEKIKSHNCKVGQLGRELIPGFFQSRLEPIFENLQVIHVDEKTFAKAAPGLNMLGTCKTENCKDSDKLTVIPKGCGEGKKFSIRSECAHTNCPSCDNQIRYAEINHIILKNSTFALEAMNLEGKHIKGVFQVTKGEYLGIDIRKLKFMEIKFH